MWKKLVSLMMVAILTTGTFVTPAFAESLSASKSTSKEELIDVTIYSDEDTTIIAMVPKSQEQAYLNELKDPNFRLSEVQKHLSYVPQIKGLSAEPEVSVTSSEYQNHLKSSGDIGLMADVTKYYRKREVIQTVDHMDKTSYNWDRFLSNPLTDYAIGRAAGYILRNSVIGHAIGATLWLAVDLRARQEQWWKDSALMILRGQIRGVKLEITYNRQSNYPAAWRILSRY